MNGCVAVLYHNGELHSLHQFKLPNNLERYMEQVIALTDFQQNEATRFFSLFDTKFELDWRATVTRNTTRLASAYAIDLQTFHSNLPCFEHQDLWEFFHNIGYDSAQRKYMGIPNDTPEPRRIGRLGWDQDSHGSELRSGEAPPREAPQAQLQAPQGN
jgi:hypothetical protein